ncbi:MAG: DUF5009 domain-containing protein [Planctomycetes bacterium]|nr:DUF5009 domain-containing protein [Planctomycetota bacterium]
MEAAPASPLQLPVPAPERGRLLSLDALRGFDMFWILGGDGLVQAIHRLCGDPVTGMLATQFDHCAWAGFHAEDLIFPLFVFIAGISLVFSLAKTIAREGRAVAVRRIIRRGLLLVLFGIFSYGGLADGWEHVRLLGVLQRIGLAYMFAGLLFCFLKPRGLVIACAAILVGYWAVMTFVPIRDVRLDHDALAALAQTTGISDEHELFTRTTATVSGRFEPGYNVSDHLDYQYLPSRKWDRYYDPEGLLSTLPAVATCLLGVFAGLLLRLPGLSDRRRLAWMVGGGLGLLALGWAWDLQFPVIKKVWTSSFVLVAGGWSVLLLAAFHWLIDVKMWKGWIPPFVWIGMNAITAYMAANILDFHGLAARLVGGPIAHALDAHVATGLGAVVGMLGEIGLVLLFVWFLYRRQIFLRL